MADAPGIKKIYEKISKYIINIKRLKIKNA